MAYGRPLGLHVGSQKLLPTLLECGIERLNEIAEHACRHEDKGQWEGIPDTHRRGNSIERRGRLEEEPATQCLRTLILTLSAEHRDEQRRRENDCRNHGTNQYRVDDSQDGSHVGPSGREQQYR